MYSVSAKFRAVKSSKLMHTLILFYLLYLCSGDWNNFRLAIYSIYEQQNLCIMLYSCENTLIIIPEWYHMSSFLFECWSCPGPDSPWLHTFPRCQERCQSQSCSCHSFHYLLWQHTNDMFPHHMFLLWYIAFSDITKQWQSISCFRQLTVLVFYFFTTNMCQYIIALIQLYPSAQYTQFVRTM